MESRKSISNLKYLTFYLVACVNLHPDFSPDPGVRHQDLRAGRHDRLPEHRDGQPLHERHAQKQAICGETRPVRRSVDEELNVVLQYFMSGLVQQRIARDLVLETFVAHHGHGVPIRTGLSV